MAPLLFSLFGAAIIVGLVAVVVARARDASGDGGASDGASSPTGAAADGARRRPPSFVQRIRLGLLSPDRERRKSSILKLGLLSGEGEWPVHELTGALRDIGADPELRALAAQALAQRGARGEEVVAALHAALMDKHPALLLAALRAVRTLGRDAASLAPLVARHVRSPTEAIRLEAALTLGVVGELDGATAALLWDVVENESAYDWTTRLVAAAELLRADGAHAERLLPTLQMALRQGSPADREGAIGVLALLGPPWLGLLTKSLQHDAPQVRVGAARVLRHLECEAAVALPLVQEAARHEDPAVRAEAMIAFGKLLEPGRDALRTLLPFLADGSASVRQTAIRVITSWGPAGVAPMLRELSQRGAEYARRPFYTALEGLGRDALPEVEALFGTGSAAERREVVLALRAVRVLGEAAGGLMERAVVDPDGAVRSEAEQAMRAAK